MIAFGESVDAAVHARVLDLDRRFAAFPPPGFAEAVPTFTALLVRFDPVVTDHATIEAAARALFPSDLTADETPPRIHSLPVCYDGAFAPDLAAVAHATGLSAEAVIAAHAATRYRVSMYGFAPGYAYLADVPEPLRLPRKPVPVRSVPRGSVLIAGAQCLVATLDAPSGWWNIGRSPARILTGDDVRPFLFDVGDEVRFERVSLAAYTRGETA